MRKKKIAVVAEQAAEALVERLKLAEEALRAQQLDLPQAEESVLYAEAIAHVLGSLGAGEGVFFISRLLVVKRRDCDGGEVRALTLSVEQYRAARERGITNESVDRIFEFIGQLDAAGNERLGDGGGESKAEV